LGGNSTGGSIVAAWAISRSDGSVIMEVESCTCLAERRGRDPDVSRQRVWPP
jgi:hypothetical protein